MSPCPAPARAPRRCRCRRCEPRRLRIDRRGSSRRTIRTRTDDLPREPRDEACPASAGGSSERPTRPGPGCRRSSSRVEGRNGAGARGAGGSRRSCRQAPSRGPRRRRPPAVARESGRTISSACRSSRKPSLAGYDRRAIAESEPPKRDGDDIHRTSTRSLRTSPRTSPRL